MSGAKKRQTMAKQARERAVREKRALKEERKRDRKLGLADETDPADLPADLNDPGHRPTDPGLRLVAEDGVRDRSCCRDRRPCRDRSRCG